MFVNIAFGHVNMNICIYKFGTILLFVNIAFGHVIRYKTTVCKYCFGHVYINAETIVLCLVFIAKEILTKGIKGSVVSHTPSLKMCIPFRAIRPLLSVEPQVLVKPLGVSIIESKRGHV